MYTKDNEEFKDINDRSSHWSWFGKKRVYVNRINEVPIDGAQDLKDIGDPFKHLKDIDSARIY